MKAGCANRGRSAWPSTHQPNMHAEHLPQNILPPQPKPTRRHPAGELDHDPQHVPHLLDFHSPRRPEFILFWSAMVICFAIGFLPAKRDAEAPDGG
jgi:hypothetical protein